jgi:uncharacterized protein
MMMDPIYLVYMIPGLIIGLYAQFKLRSAYGHYSQVGVSSGMTGAQAAREILDNAGLSSMPINETQGQLSDHYDPTRKALFLSSDNFHGRSLAAVGVAAHEAGHALQHKAAYAPLHIRMALVPVTNIASRAVYFILLLGFIFAATKLLWTAVILFSAIAIFQLITLPVEYDASRRAKQELFKLGIVSPHEQAGVRSVLSAAALTYVAAMVSSLLTLLYYVSIARSSNRD